MFVLLLLAGIPVSLVVINLDSFDMTYALATILGEVAAIGVLPVILLCLPMGRGLREDLLRLTRKVDVRLLLIIPIGLVGYFFVNGISAVWMGSLTCMGLNPDALSQAIPTPQNTAQYLLSIVTIGVVPALCEELFYRGMMLPVMHRKFRNPWMAIVLSGTLFALMHGNTLALPGHVVLGIAIGYVVYVTGSIWAGVILHFIQNSLAMTILYFQDNITSWLPDVESGAALPGMEDNPFMAIMEDLQGPTLILGGWVYMVVAGVAFFGLLYLLYRTYKKKLGVSPFALQPEESAAEAAALQPLLDAQAVQPSRLTRFIPWIPLVAAAPIALMNYGLTLLAMTPFFQSLL